MEVQQPSNYGQRIGMGGTLKVCKVLVMVKSLFNGDTGNISQKLEWQGSLVSMVLNPDGDVVACGSQDNTVHFWRRSTGKDSMIWLSTKLANLAFDHTGTLLATGGSEDSTGFEF